MKLGLLMLLGLAGISTVTHAAQVTTKNKASIDCQYQTKDYAFLKQVQPQVVTASPAKGRKAI